MGESNAVRVRRPLMRIATAKRAAEIYVEKFGKEDRSLPATYQVTCLDSKLGVAGDQCVSSTVHEHVVSCLAMLNYVPVTYCLPVSHIGNAAAPLLK